MAEFVLVYIREAHAADGSSPQPIPNERPIRTPKTDQDRCDIAGRFMKKKRLKYICVTDDIRNTVDEAYDAFPDRIYIVDKDGKIALQGAPGPMGFPDTIKKVKKWLRDYRKQMKAESTKTEG